MKSIFARIMNEIGALAYERYCAEEIANTTRFYFRKNKKG